MLAAGAVAYVEDAVGVHRELIRSLFELALLAVVAFSLPGYEDSVFAQEGRGQLGEG